MPRSSSAFLPRSLATALVCGILASAAPADAQDTSDPAAVEAARAEFSEGQGHFRAKRWAEALRAFEKSYGGVPSPNAQLMIARCLRELGRGPDAAAVFSAAESEARKRVNRGENKYADTAEAAATEGKALTRTLGTLKIHVTGNATLTVDKKPVSLSDGDAVVLHEPGSVQVSVKDSAGAEQRQTVTVTAGNAVTMEFSTEGGRTAPPPITPPPRRDGPTPEPETEAPGWMLPAVLVSGGVALAGTGIFIGFGASATSTYNTLSTKCGPSDCTQADQATADAGRRSQLIANVGLGVAITGVIATAVILYLGLTNQRVVAKGAGL